jgi:hypothetical protein
MSLSDKQRAPSRSNWKPTLGQRVCFIDDPAQKVTILRVRKAARRSFYNLTVRLDSGETFESISSCWMRMCHICGTPEKTDGILLKLTPHSDICTSCVNKLSRQPPQR